mgnify:CR=1 FL=1
MLETFFAALTPILTLFICITAGFTVRKANIVDRSAGKTLSKLVLWIFCPAQNFSAMAKNCTTQTLSTHAVNIILGCCAVVISILIAIVLSRLFVRKKSPERGIYAYALAFANIFKKDPRLQDMQITAIYGDEDRAESEKVQALFPDAVIVDKVADMLGKVDAVMITARDGIYHAEFARPFLEEGLPMLR